MATQTTSRREFHPAVSILSWLVFALAVELAGQTELHKLWLAGALLLIQRGVFQRFVMLAWKARWLWLALFALHAWTVPGILLLPTSWSPTTAGLEAALIRIERLLLMLAALAWLLTVLNPARIAAGVYLLAKPFARLGLDRRALAVRLALALELELEQAENMPKAGRWLDRLKFPQADASESTEIRLAVPQISRLDIGILLAALMLGVLAV